MSEHLLVATGDDDEDTFAWQILCPTPAKCNGWQECGENHRDHDPREESSPSYDQYEDVEIHGQLHDWNSYGWIVPYPGCVVADSDVEPFYDIPRRAGVWIVDDDWDDTECTITPVREISQEELQMKRYKNGKTVFDMNDMAVLSADRDPSVPLTEGQRAFLEAVVNAAPADAAAPEQDEPR